MFADNKDLEFLERHFAGQLTEKEQALFKTSMETNSEFQEFVTYFEDFMVGVEHFGDKQIMLELKGFEQKIQKEEREAALSGQKTNKLQDLWQQFVNKADYTLEQLAELFKPVPIYQPLLAHVHRGNNIPLQKTEEEWDLAVSAIELKFSEPTPVDLSIVIENNSRQSVWISTVPKNSITFPIRLEDTMIDAPGRYYLKLSNNKDLVVHEIFVRKDWMA